MTYNASGILLCAGDSRRMGENKLLMRFGGKTVMEHSLCAMTASGIFTEMIIAVNETTAAEAKRLARLSPIPVTVAEGGATRQESVARALWLVKGDIVVVHDAARCLASPALFRACADSAAEFGSGVAAIDVRDTIAKRTGGVTRRSELIAVQTPQAFNTADFRAAHRMAEENNVTGTDDSALYMLTGLTATYVEGSIMNQKLTLETDIPFMRAALEPCRTGFGEDTHVLAAGLKLILGGVEIPYDRGLVAHSDGDALIHAVIDAMLGAAAMGDVGRHFPDNDDRYRGASSMMLLKRAAELVREAGYDIINADGTVIAQAPKLLPYMHAMCENIASALDLPLSAVSVKATTTEGMNAEGEGKCITARAVVTLR